jgi:hypothetical protein
MVLPFVWGREGVRRVLPDRRPGECCDLADRIHVAGVARDVYGQDRLRPGRHGDLDERRLHDECRPIDVHEHRNGTDLKYRRRRRRERVCGGADVAPLAHRRRLEREVQPRRTGRDGHRTGGTDSPGKLHLEPRAAGSRCDSPGPESFDDLRDLPLADVGAAERNALHADSPSP